MSINWVMLSQDGDVVRLPHEKILHQTKSRIGLEISTPRQFQSPTPLSVKSETGKVYITNKRLIYLPDKRTDQFQSFFAPILNFEDTHVSSTFFGPWSWSGLVKPVPQGGVPLDIPRIEVKITFKDGGHNEFREKFEQIKERLHYARDLEAETGQRVTVDDEPLPQYEADAPNNSSAPPVARNISSASQARSSQPPPNEPPPDYEEAQAQTLGMRLEEHFRETERQ